MVDVALWTASSCFFLLGMREWFWGSGKGELTQLLWGVRRELRSLGQLKHTLTDLSDFLKAGLVPPDEIWIRLGTAEGILGESSRQVIGEIRTGGGAILPTVQRLLNLVKDQEAALGVGRVRISQALSQTLVCAGMVPVMGVILSLLLPSLAQNPWLWWGGVGLALLPTLGAVFWLCSMAERARWGGLSPERRPWYLLTCCAGEKFLSHLRTGSPPDLAWGKTHDALHRECSPLASLWGANPWVSDVPNPFSSGIPYHVVQAAHGLRNIVQVGTMEGRPCGEKVESLFDGIRRDVSHVIEKELNLLTSRALKPLFLMVAPSLFFLLALSLWLTWKDMSL